MEKSQELILLPVKNSLTFSLKQNHCVTFVRLFAQFQLALKLCSKEYLCGTCLLKETLFTHHTQHNIFL